MNKTLNNVIINVDFEEPEEFEGLQTGARLGQLMGQTAAGLKKVTESYESLIKAIEKINEDIEQLSGIDIPYTVDGETDEDKVVTFEYPTTFGLLNAGAVKVGSLAVYPNSIYSESGFTELNSVTSGFYIASGDKYADIRYSIVIGAGHNFNASVAPSVDQSLVLGGGISIGNQIYYSLVNGSGSTVSDGVRYSILGGSHFEAKSLDTVLAIPNVGLFSGKTIKNSIIYGGFHRYAGDAEELNNMLIGGINSDLSIITADKGYSVIIGNGTSSELKNILTLDNDGNLTISGKITASNGFGENNTIVNNYNTIVSGNTNDIANTNNSLISGTNNIVSSSYDSIIFGSDNTFNGSKSLLTSQYYNGYASYSLISGDFSNDFSNDLSFNSTHSMLIGCLYSSLTSNPSSDIQYSIGYSIISAYLHIGENEPTVGNSISLSNHSLVMGNNIDIENVSSSTTILEHSLILSQNATITCPITRSIIMGTGFNTTAKGLAINDSIIMANSYQDNAYLETSLSLVMGWDIQGNIRSSVVVSGNLSANVQHSLVCGSSHNVDEGVTIDHAIIGGYSATVHDNTLMALGMPSATNQGNALELDDDGNLTISGSLNLYDASGNKYALTVENGNLKLTLAQ